MCAGRDTCERHRCEHCGSPVRSADLVTALLAARGGNASGRRRRAAEHPTRTARSTLSRMLKAGVVAVDEKRCYRPASAA
jgi:hypothetical protein